MEETAGQTDGGMEMIWMSSRVREGRCIPMGAVGAAMGVAALVVALAAAGTVLSLRLGAAPGALTALCLCLTALAVLLARRAGRRVAGDALVFFLEDDRLYAVDVRRLVRYRRGLLGYVESSAETRRRLERIRRGETPWDGAEELQAVESLEEKPGGYVFRCRVIHGNGCPGARTYRLEKGVYREQDRLLRELERRRERPGPGGRKE